MSIEKVPFQTYKLEEEKAIEEADITLSVVIPTKFNKKEELPRLKILQDLLQQEQQSTAIKQAIEIAIEVLLDKKTLLILSYVLNNYRRNKRKGLVTYDDTNYQNLINRNTL